MHDERGKTVYANQAAVELLGCETVEEVLAAEPGELAARFTITHEDGSPVPLEDLPGRRLVAGEDAPSLLTRSVRRDTGEAFWLLTKATLYTRPDGRAAGHQHHRGRHRGQGRRAAPALPGRGRPGARLLARLRADARARRAHGRARARRLVRGRHARRAGRAPAGRGRPRRSREGRRWRRTCGAATRRTRTRPPACPRSCAAARPSCTPRSRTSCSSRPPRDEEHLRLIRAVGMRSAMAVPMRIGDETLGAITLVSAESGRRFDEDDLAFAEDLALRAATAVQNARLYAAQERVAHTLQASLLPERLPDAAGLGGARGLPGGRARRRRGRRLLRHPARRGRPPDRARRRDRQGRRGRRPDLARAPLGAHGGALRPAAGARAGADQRGAARAAAAVAGDRRLRAGGDRRRPARSRSPRPATRCRCCAAPASAGAARRPRRAARRGGEDDWTETRSSSARRHAAVLHRRRDRDAGRAQRASARRGCARRWRGPARRRRRCWREIERSLREFQAGVTLDDRAMLALRFVGARARGARVPASMRTRYDVVVVGGGHNGARRRRLPRARGPLGARARAARRHRRRRGLRGAVRRRRRAAVALRLPRQPAAAPDRRRARAAVRDAPAPDLLLHAGAGPDARRAGRHATTPSARGRRPVTGDDGVRRVAGASTTASARVARAVFPTLLEPLADARRAARAGRRRRGLGGAVRAADRRGDRGDVRRRRAARGRR